MVHRALSWRQLYGVVLDSIHASGVITLIVAGSFLLNHAFTAEGVPQAMAQWVDALQLGPTGFLRLVNLASLLLLALTFFPHIVLWLPQTMGYGVQ